VAGADLALVIVDARESGAGLPADAAAISQLPAALPRLVVHNKIDLTSAAPRVVRHGGLGGHRARGAQPSSCRRRPGQASTPCAARSARSLARRKT
jgi:tRNA U34 5-carboxymethylaminomethyl modifying GTPase MnmE/TrmE